MRYSGRCEPSVAGFALAILLLASSVHQVIASDDSLPDLPTFGTLAGDGTNGLRDGAAIQADFMGPVGLAYTPAGDIIVVDRVAERIRLVSSSGVVTTIAGSGNPIALGLGVPGGFRDGPALQALFNAPQSAVAMPDGSVLVADTYNFCLRRIAGGVVRTFAGSHLESARVDGELSIARFELPRALAIDRVGKVYIADSGSGVRVIDATGHVSTLRFPDSAAVSALSTVPGNLDMLVVATSEHIEWIDLKHDTVSGVLNFRTDYTSSWSAIVAIHTVGPASSLVALDDNDVIYTDPLFGAIRLAQRFEGETYERVLSSVPTEDSPYGGGSYRDGAGTVASFDEPMGIALSRNGRAIAIADTGNRRIRSMSPFDTRTHVSALASGTEVPSRSDPAEYRIALVGDSYVWADQAWHESIAGLTQDILQSDLPQMKRKPRIYPIMRFGMPNNGALDLINNELAFGNFDLVVLDLTTQGHITDDGSTAKYFPTGFDTALAASLTATAAVLRSSKTQFIVLSHPGANDMPIEMAYLHIPKGLPGESHDYAQYRDPYAIQLYHEQIVNTIRNALVVSVDAWPAFINEYDSSDRRPLFNTWDHHLTLLGRQLVAQALAKKIKDQMLAKVLPE